MVFAAVVNFHSAASASLGDDCRLGDVTALMNFLLA
jgi:hypothetical protein